MIATDLNAFADLVIRTGRVTFGDVQRLHRNVLPDGVSSREEIETLLRIEREVRRYDRSFAAWLVAHVVDYAVWGERPTGVLTEEMSEWLAPLLDKSRPVLVRIAKEIAAEAQEVGTSLDEFVAAADACPVPAEAESAASPVELAA